MHMTNHSIIIGVQIKEPAIYREPIRMLDRSDPFMTQIVGERFRALLQLDLAAKQMPTDVIR